MMSAAGAAVFMTKSQILPAWGRILRGRKPFLSIEVTRECPLRCPGCYAYAPSHVNGAGGLRNISDLRGDDLIDGVLALVRRQRPLHVSLVGGEPLMRGREIGALLPLLTGVETQLITSAVAPIPREWAAHPDLHVVVSVDGLAEDHDRRRAPATYSRILDNIAGHKVIVHCTVTRRQTMRPGYLQEFAAFWSARAEARKIWFSLFTPQQGELCEERLSAQDRRNAIAELRLTALEFPKVQMPDLVLEGFLQPPAQPSRCIFAQVTHCVSADLRTVIAPCELGGRPDCRECGCLAAAGLGAIGRVRLAGSVRVGDVFRWSSRIGRAWGGATA